MGSLCLTEKKSLFQLKRHILMEETQHKLVLLEVDKGFLAIIPI
jgi:hypothetical protein